MTDCLYCGAAIDDAHEYYHVATTTSQDTILKQCSSRKDIWTERVRESSMYMIFMQLTLSIIKSVASTSGLANIYHSHLLMKVYLRSHE